MFPPFVASGDPELAKEGKVRIHAIVQGSVICLLLVWTAVWDVPSSDAGGPPIRLAVYQSDTLEVDELPDPDTLPQNPEERVYTQPIPTEIRENTIRLIPTEVDSDVVITAGSGPAIEKPCPHFSGSFIDAASFLRFLDLHLSTAAFPAPKLKVAGQRSENTTPWIMGEQPSEFWLGMDQPLDWRLYRMSVDCHYTWPAIDQIWLPASEWWRMAGTAIPKSDF